jgi:hypothetical protein
VATDSQKIFEVALNIHLVWSCPLQILAVSVLLYILIGPASLVGIGIFIAILPLAKVSAMHILYFVWRHPMLEPQLRMLRTLEVMSVPMFAVVSWKGGGARNAPTSVSEG